MRTTQSSFNRRGALLVLGTCGMLSLPYTAYCSSDHGHDHGHGHGHGHDETKKLFRGNHQEVEMAKPYPKYMGLFTMWGLFMFVVCSGTMVL